METAAAATAAAAAAAGTGAAAGAAGATAVTAVSGQWQRWEAQRWGGNNRPARERHKTTLPKAGRPTSLLALRGSGF